MELDRSTTIDR